MAFTLNPFKRKTNTTSASAAKERLQIIVAHQRNETRSGRDFIPVMRQELIDVIKKYFDVNDDTVEIQIGNQDGCSILELNVSIPN